MAWTEQNPAATDIVFQGRTYNDEYKHFEIDRLPSGEFRITVGNLFGFQEICRNTSLEAAIRDFFRACNPDQGQRS